MRKKTRIGLIEEPALKLTDPYGRNWAILRQNEPLGSKQILAGTLFGAGYDVRLFNLRGGTGETIFGEVEWKQMKMTKIAAGTPWTALDPKECDVWGLTINFQQDREIGRRIIEYLSARGGRVAVGGSDVFAEPKPYLEAGALVAVMDKSGMSNKAAIEVALNRNPEGHYRLYTKNGWLNSPGHFSRLHPENWPLPPPEFVKETFGDRLWRPNLSRNLLPTGAVMFDHGCDRHCDFCETPSYKLGYQYMSPERALEWLALQKQAGANSVTCLSDQFLGRILYKNGREEILRIMKGIRELEIAISFSNGLELAKATLGRGFKNGDPTPDEELVSALFGWDGKSGCSLIYAPAERPIEGTAAYAKLLPWRSHVEMLKAIVRAGVPDISYGVIIGFPDDSNEKMKILFEEVVKLKSELIGINPALSFRIRPHTIIAIPSTPLARELKSNGLIRFEDDPSIAGGLLTPNIDTYFMSYKEVSDWQIKMFCDFEGEKTWEGFTK
ncbi:MAG: radical SAM protein [Parcubacteria group bacterium]|nr:radical SAM protein [Parcubacteria group bacterium]